MSKTEFVLGWLEEHGIEYQVHYHPPLPTIEEALDYWKNIDSTHCKNLFFRNHKGNRHYMASFECHKNLDIHGLEHIVRQGKLSFASPERMDRCIGVTPGSVCAYGLINDMNLVEHPAIISADGTRDFGWIKEGVNPKELFDNGHRVKYFLDAELKTAERISFHPCENTASVVVSNAAFLRFLEIWGGEIEWIPLGTVPFGSFVKNEPNGTVPNGPI